MKNKVQVPLPRSHWITWQPKVALVFLKAVAPIRVRPWFSLGLLECLPAVITFTLGDRLHSDKAKLHLIVPWKSPMDRLKSTCHMT